MDRATSRNSSQTSGVSSRSSSSATFSSAGALIFPASSSVAPSPGPLTTACIFTGTTGTRRGCPTTRGSDSALRSAGSSPAYPLRHGPAARARRGQPPQFHRGRGGSPQSRPPPPVLAGSAAATAAGETAATAAAVPATQAAATRRPVDLRSRGPAARAHGSPDATADRRAPCPAPAAASGTLRRGQGSFRPAGPPDQKSVVY
ncbi:hypothetical protein G6F35_014926 [Rhizopus arrhizus]|nr:hypothetical protein G6F35_014926 [Rhizopus arrhizus]